MLSPGAAHRTVASIRLACPLGSIAGHQLQSRAVVSSIPVSGSLVAWSLGKRGQLARKVEIVRLGRLADARSNGPA